MTRPGENGFILVDALAAVTVAAVTAAALLTATTSARLHAAEAAARTRALQTARALLDEPFPNRAAETSGRIDPARLEWRRQVQPLAPFAGVMAVEVEVVWTAGRRSGEVRLATYRFADG